jgi:hypothetical protein
MADDGEKLTFWFQLVTPHGPRHKVEKGKEPFDVPAGFGLTRRPAPVRGKETGDDTASSNRNFNLICATAMGGGNHGHDPGRWVDLVEKTPRADTIPPYVRVWRFQSFDIRTC